MTPGERILLWFCRSVNEEDYAGGTARANLDNALSFLDKTVPNFRSMIRDQEVLDFGCGYGLQAAAIARAGARSVVGLDLPRPKLLEKWQEIEKLKIPNLILTTDPPQARQFDVVFSCSSFEHFSDPGATLGLMRQYVKPGGRVVISFAEPWLSPRGSHMDGITRLPWVNVLFSEATVMRVRSRYRQDGARRYEDVEGGLNRMTVRRFETLMRESGMRVEDLRLFAVRKLPLVTRIPVLREYLTGAASCVLVAESR